MRSWSNWTQLSKENIKTVPRDAKGVYVIRIHRKDNAKSSTDIIYIGSSGTGKQGIGRRLNNLMNGLKKSDKSASNNHSASQKIRQYVNKNLEFSWVPCSQAPDGVEKALLLGFWVSTGKLPVCNSRF